MVLHIIPNFNRIHSTPNSSSGSGPAGKNSSFGHIISKYCFALIVAISKSNEGSGSLATKMLSGKSEFSNASSSL